MQGEFDRIYQAPDGTIRIVEAKGGSSPLSGRKTPEGYAQQGTVQYYESILSAMDNSGKIELENLANTIRIAKQNGKLEYWLIRQDFDNAGNLKDIYANKFPI